MNLFKCSLLLGLVLLTACDQTQESIPAPAPKGMVLIPAGGFWMGSDERDTEGRQKEFGFREPMYLNEHPKHQQVLPAYYIDQYEVRNGDYKRFIVETDSTPPPPWVQSGYNASRHRLATIPLDTLRQVAVDYFLLDRDTGVMEKPELLEALELIQKGRDSLPATAMNWYDAASYCLWLGKRLPSEAEWEKAARGIDGRRYPWGDDWDNSKANIGDNDEGITLAGGRYPQDRSMFGVYDLGGNVSEWVADWYQPYSGNMQQSEFYGDIHKVVKGGGAGVGHYALSYFFRSSRRGQADPGVLSIDVGFRCASTITNI